MEEGSGGSVPVDRYEADEFVAVELPSASEVSSSPREYKSSPEYAHHAADDGVEAGLRRGGAGERRRALGERADRLELGVRRLEVGFGGGGVGRRRGRRVGRALAEERHELGAAREGEVAEFAEGVGCLCGRRAGAEREEEKTARNRVVEQDGVFVMNCGRSARANAFVG